MALKEEATDRFMKWKINLIILLNSSNVQGALSRNLCLRMESD